MHKGLVRDLKTLKKYNFYDFDLFLTKWRLEEFNTQHEIREKIVVCGAGGRWESKARNQWKKRKGGGGNQKTRNPVSVAVLNRRSRNR